MASTLRIISHWHYSVENLSTSSLDFYSEVERVLKVKEVEVKTERIGWREGHIFSAKRDYLRVRYGKYVFDIGAAPFGKDFFWSWWMGTKPGFLESLPYIGVLFRHLVKPTTYFSEDTRQMFEETVHRVVLDVVSGVLTTAKMAPLTAAERALTKRQKEVAAIA
jgi:hypothetical protein